MGIINITPDSFSDGGKYLDSEAAFAQSINLIEQGADIIDLGSESTRPGADPVPLEIEWKRLEPVLRKLSNTFPSIKLSIDTQKPEIILRALKYNIHMVNNTSGLTDRTTLEVLGKKTNVHYLAMHTNGTSRSMQKNPLTRQRALDEVSHFFKSSFRTLVNSGFAKERIWMDPGIGFGKTDAANVALMAATSTFASDYNVACGISRKSIFGRQLDITSPEERDHVSKVTEFALVLAGAKLIRTHNIHQLTRLKHLLTKVEE